jgi:hypothetical protein
MSVRPPTFLNTEQQFLLPLANSILRLINTANCTNINIDNNNNSY